MACSTVAQLEHGWVEVESTEHHSNLHCLALVGVGVVRWKHEEEQDVLAPVAADADEGEVVESRH